MDWRRRSFLRGASLFGAGLFAARQTAAAGPQASQHEMQMPPGKKMDHADRARSGAHRAVGEPRLAVPAVTPDVPDLPFEMDNGVKVFHLIAEPVKQEILPGKVINLWGYSGSAPGPTIQVNQGDRVRIVVDNHLPEATAMHWHGFEVPNDMDGVPGITQAAIPPGGRQVYEFTLNQEGTYFYHSHMAMQEMLGMLGAFIMHPKDAYDPPIDRDFVVMLQEYAILPSNPTPNTMNMEFNWLTLNGKSGPAATPLIVRAGERVKIRMINMGMDHHPMHLHGNQFVVTGTEAGRQPKSTWGPQNTVLVAVAQARDIEFVANNPGDWMLHCHLPHHMMNQMSSMVGPLTRRQGLPAGVGMEEGMGMLREGGATSQGNGPSLGRGMGVGSTLDETLSNGPLSQKNAGALGSSNGMQMDVSKAEVSKDANSVPGFPQDAFMEGPVMAMDAMFAKPENYGLRPGWSGYMGGMMTLVRVLPPDQYDHIMELRQKNGKQQPQEMPNMPGMQMPK